MKCLPPADQAELGTYDVSAQLIARVVIGRGLPVDWITRTLFVTRQSDRLIGFSRSRSSMVSSAATRTVSRRDVLRLLLEDAGLPVVDGRRFLVRERRTAQRFARDLGSAVSVRPAEIVGARSLDAHGPEDFARAWSQACAHPTHSVLVERLSEGVSLRLMVVGGVVVAALRRMPPVVLGDGRTTLASLLATHLVRRSERLGDRLGAAQMSAWVSQRAKELHRELDSVPAVGERLLLRAVDRRDLESIDVTDVLGSEFCALAVRAVAAIPGLGVAGVDLRVEDGAHWRSDHQHVASVDHAGEPAAVVTGISTEPQLAPHHFPLSGTPRDAASSIAAHVLAFGSSEDVTATTPGRAVPSSCSTPVPSAVARDLDADLADSSLPRRRRERPGLRWQTAMRFPSACKAPFGFYEFSSHLLAVEAERAGFPLRWWNRSFFTVELPEEPLAFWSTRVTGQSAVAAAATLRKQVTRRLLEDNGVPVAEGKAFSRSSRDVARAYARDLGGPVVVKPFSGEKGDGVSVGVEDGEAFDLAWARARSAGTRGVLVERVVPGKDVRILVVSGQVVAAVQRSPACVVGTGRDSLRTLIQQSNRRRRRNPHLRRRPLKLDARRIEWLAQHGWLPGDAPPMGRSVVLDDRSNLSTGGESRDVTDVLPPGLRSMAVRAVESFPGLLLGGVDMVVADVGREPEPGSAVVLEVNSVPGIAAHHFPLFGSARNAAGAIVAAVIQRHVGGSAQGDSRISAALDTPWVPPAPLLFDRRPSMATLAVLRRKLDQPFGGPRRDME